MTLLSFSSFAVATVGARSAQAKADIAVILPDSQSSVRWESFDRVYLDAAFKAAGVTYSIVNAQGDKQAMITDEEAAITNGAKVLLFTDLDTASGATVIAEARKGGAKVIDYDRLTTEGPGADFYVSFDGFAVGVAQGNGLVAAIKAAGLVHPVVAELNGSPTDNNAKLFASGYDSILDPLYKDGTFIKGDNQSVPDWDNTKAETIFEQMLTAAKGKIDAAVAANDGLAIAVNSALANQGLKPIPVTGQDATVGGIQQILEGKQSMTVYKAVKAQANAAAALAIALLKGTDTKALATQTVDQTVGGKNAAGNKALPAVILPVTSVTKDNIGSTVIADGFLKWADICVGDAAPFCPPEASATMAATMAATAAN